MPKISPSDQMWEGQNYAEKEALLREGTGHAEPLREERTQCPQGGFDKKCGTTGWGDLGTVSATLDL